MDLAAHYSRFRVTERILLTGHSHQAWPDVSFDAQQRAWLDAAALVDDKWEQAAAIAEEVCAGWRRLLSDPDGDIALGQNTHELVVRLLSAVLAPVSQGQGEPGPRRRLVTTDGEFHTIRRQLDRLAEVGIDVIKVAARPADTLADRLAQHVDDRVACVLVSSVLYETAEIVPQLSRVAEACHRHGAHLLVDAYHHLNVVPFNVRAFGLDQAFITGGGYKYCQLGEGNCFLRVPDGCRMRPVLTGWFAEFEALNESHGDVVAYGPGAAAFAGATYDPVSHYRAAAVLRFHREHGLTPDRLYALNQRQVEFLRRGVEQLDRDPTILHVDHIPATRRGGFLAVRAPRAAEYAAALKQQGVHTDTRGHILRLGPAPYVADGQLQRAVDALAAVTAH